MTAQEAAAAEAAEDWLLERELFGMRFGLDRMRRLLTALGSPQDAFRSIHVVGTNGKSSTVRMTAALLERHGTRAGAYLSPHLTSFRERIRVGDADLPPGDFARAVDRVRRAAEKVDRTLGPGDRVTQFEALTAAAYDELARRDVDVAVVEAGLGGRWDATNVIASEVQVLTNVGLEHTRWLGPTVRDIAREKLAVVRPGATLVLGDDLHPDALEEAHRTPAARMVVAHADAGLPMGARGGFQRRNFALARAAAEALLGRLDPAAVRLAAASVSVPGRFEVVADEPLTILDGAHNPGGMRALAAGLRAEVGDRPVVPVLSILDDKDAADMIRALLPLAEGMVLTSNSNPRALSPATLASLADQLGGVGAAGVHIDAEPHRALEAARGLAGPQGVVLATGSIYLVADLLRDPAQPSRPRSTL